MDGIGAGQPGDADQFVDLQIASTGPRCALADQIGLVGLEAVQRQLVLFGIDGDGLDAELVGGAEHADGDFAAVGDEDLLDRQGGAPMPEKTENPAMISVKMLQCKQNRQAVRND